MSAKSKTIAAVSVIILVFLAGFVPQFLDKRRVQTELDDTRTKLSTAQRQIAIDEIRRLAGSMLLEASRQNYGTAREHSTEYFNRVSEMADKPENFALRNSLAELLNLRDSVTSNLAQANASVLSELQSLMEKTYNLPDARDATH
jgi:hypothetical protein